jgi:hypothetical protein
MSVLKRIMLLFGSRFFVCTCYKKHTQLVVTAFLTKNCYGEVQVRAPDSKEGNGSQELLYSIDLSLVIAHAAVKSQAVNRTMFRLSAFRVSSCDGKELNYSVY